MRVALGADHAGVMLKDALARAFDEAATAGEMVHTYVDFGTHGTARVDYPDFATPVAEGVACGAFDRGILVCGTGVGMSIAANKVRGVRAALVHDVDGARLSREHNDANIVALAGLTLSPDTARDIVRTFLETSFAGGRHQRRVDGISKLEPQTDDCP